MEKNKVNMKTKFRNAQIKTWRKQDKYDDKIQKSSNQKLKNAQIKI